MVSIVVPIYNVELYLEKCINSLIEQTYTDIEIILVDDGSTDKSSLICDRYALLDNRITVIHKMNGGLVSARKAGTEYASGEYIVNVDGDDWIDNNRIQELVENGISSGADMIYMSGIRKEFENESVLCKNELYMNMYRGNSILTEVVPLLMSDEKCFQISIRGNLVMWAIKRELLKEQQRLVDDRIALAEDQICIWLCLSRAKVVKLIDQDGYHYVQRRSSLTYIADASDDEKIQIWYRQLRKFLLEYNVYNKVKSNFKFLAVMVIMFSNYGLLLHENLDYLFPFSKVKKGSRIAVYGAGKFGRSLMKALMKSQNYQVVLWVDRSENRQPIMGMPVSPIKTLFDEEFDYVVLALFEEDTAMQVKSELMNMGIEEEKIAVMDANAIKDNELPEEFV